MAEAQVFAVLCSCGNAADITWIEDEQWFECEEPGWVFSGVEDGERLWNCGKPGHWQSAIRAAPSWR